MGFESANDDLLEKRADTRIEMVLEQAVLAIALPIQPHSEVAVKLLMRALALGGDSAAALAAYHGFVGQLARDLEEDPSEELQALAERVRRGDWRRDGDVDRTPEPRRVGRSGMTSPAFVSKSLLCRKVDNLALQAKPTRLCICGSRCRLLSIFC